MTNLDWIESLEVNEICKKRLKEMALEASGFGFYAIQFRVKLKALREMSSEEIQNAFNQSK